MDVLNLHFEKENCSDCRSYSSIDTAQLSLPSEPIIIFDIDIIGIGYAIGNGHNGYIIPNTGDENSFGCDMKCFIGMAGDCATPYSGDEVWMDDNDFIFAK